MATPPTLLLTGASGLVGSNVASTAARRGFSVIAIVGRHAGEIPGAAHVERIDVADGAAVQALALELFPDAIVNAAAISEVPQCEADPARSHAINVALPATLAQIAHHVGARLIHLSSEQVFDGTRAPYRPSDPVAPPNLYARQKVESEQLVARFAPESAATIRLPLLGGNSLTGRRSLHERLFMTWAAGKRARLYRDEIRQPCSAENVAEMIVELCERRDAATRGLFHWAGAEPISRVEMGRRVARHFKLPADELIEEAAQADDARPGVPPRQPSLTLDCAPLAGLLKTRQESFDEMLERHAVPPDCRAWYFGR
jgi:dTDP-4-dehydrorhamnose reductase